MRKITALVTVLLFFISMYGFSQNRSIVFVDKPWAEVIEMAKSQKTLIFLDAYTSWCGPCKWMAANMFTNDSIADYYNKTFVCAHFDMEKGEGVNLSQIYQVRAYPTLMFIDAEGALVHKRVGAPQKVSDYFEMGVTALTPGEGFAAYQKKYNDGNRDPKFLMRYFERLQGAYMPVNGPLSQYFESLPETDLLKPDNWKMIYLYSSDMDSKEIIYLQKHQKEFEKRFTPDSVNQKLFSVYLQSIVMLMRSRNFTEEAFTAMKEKVKATGYSDAGKVIFTSEMNLYQMKAEVNNYLELIYKDLDTYYGNDFSVLNDIAWNVLQLTTDQKYIDKAATWAKKSVSLHSTSKNNDTYAHFLFKSGNKSEAVKYETAAIELAKKEKVAFNEYEDNLKKFQEN